jgi:Zn-dependent alcohol dehydrogenase
MPLPAARVMYHELEVVGSLGCRPVDYPPLIQLVRAGRVKLGPIVTGRVRLDEINAGLDRLRRGEGIRTIVVP